MAVLGARGVNCTEAAYNHLQTNHPAFPPVWVSEANVVSGLSSCVRRRITQSMNDVCIATTGGVQLNERRE